MVMECPICSKVLNNEEICPYCGTNINEDIFVDLHHFKNLKIHFQVLSVKVCLKAIKKI